MNKLIQLALFFTLILTGCSNSSTSSESKVETVKTTAAFPQKGLEKELQKLKPVSLDMKFESPLATELGKRKAKEEAEKQRQIAAEKKLEKEREAKRKKQQEEKAERQRLAEQQAAENQRLAEAKRQAELERQRQAAIQKEQKANAEKKRQSQAQRQQTEALYLIVKIHHLPRVRQIKPFNSQLQSFLMTMVMVMKNEKSGMTIK